MTSLEIRTLAADLLRGSLVNEFDGERQDDGAVTGDGWRVEFVPLPPARLGRFSIRALRLDVSGVREAEAAAVLRRMTMRGGG